ncbi:glutaredoxin family protein, partial [Mycobacterium sp.]|uniref:glutaredoxin family protein n=1 Tax=Mycobacterium sp. TaxID=1785 RepID=UPI00345C0C67
MVGDAAEGTAEVGPPTHSSAHGSALNAMSTRASVVASKSVSRDPAMSRTGRDKMTAPQRTEPVVEVYWRPGCPYCRMLLHPLRRSGLNLREINI